MSGASRIDTRMSLAHGRRTRLLVIYLTLGDPLTTETLDLALAAVEAGADVLELGIPTPSTAPRGAVVAESFRRAEGTTPTRAFSLMKELRSALPDIPLVPLIYPPTISDLGRDRLIAALLDSGADGMVLTAPSGEEVSDVVSSGLSAIPLVPPGDPDALEERADRMTYRTMSAVTGARLDLGRLRGIVEDVARASSKPFLAGFGISSEAEIRVVSEHAAGVVVGSELHRILERTAPGGRRAAVTAAVRGWKDATAFS